jgi:hypothetical protein
MDVLRKQGPNPGTLASCGTPFTSHRRINYQRSRERYVFVLDYFRLKVLPGSLPELREGRRQSTLTAGILSRAERGRERARHAPPFGATLWTRWLESSAEKCQHRGQISAFIIPSSCISSPNCLTTVQRPLLGFTSLNPTLRDYLTFWARFLIKASAAHLPVSAAPSV